MEGKGRGKAILGTEESREKEVLASRREKVQERGKNTEGRQETTKQIERNGCIQRLGRAKRDS